MLLLTAVLQVATNLHLVLLAMEEPWKKKKTKIDIHDYLLLYKK
jgi:hypothetical protein